MMETTHRFLSPMQQFYAGSKIFVTGATGFLGRILVEKLLRDCHVETIYVMIREKRGKEMDVRLKDLFDSVVFDRLRQEKPDFRSRVIGLYGDCAKKNLGINETDRETLKTQVNFVFHCAATVNFDEKLRMATFINIRGTREMIQLAREMKRLKFFTHVSTAYAHCHLKDLSEKFYSATYHARQLITIVEELPEATIDKIEPIIIEEYPNTYAFTKTISEQLIEELDDFPIAMYRPAIIVSTLKEPLPGWINNYYGPQGVTAGAMVGLLRTLHCDEKVDANIVPVDMCVNGLLAIPWDARQTYDEIVAFNQNAMEVDEHNLQRRKYKVPVYHFESNSTNPISWKVFRELTQGYGIEFVTVKMIGIYFFHLRKHYFSNLLAIIFLHYLPAVIYDFVLLCTGNKPRMIQAYKKVHKFSSVISYFCTQNWRYDSSNYLRLCDKMAAADSKLFFCDLRKLDWRSFFKTYLRGCRVYLIKDPLETLPEAKKLYRKFEIGTYLVLSILLIILGWIIHRLLL